MKNFIEKKQAMTIVDVIIALGIFTLGILGFTILFARSWGINAFILESAETNLKISRAVNELVVELRQIRQADNGEYMIKSGTDFDLVVYLDEDKDGITERVHYFLDNKQLKKGITNPVGSPVTYPEGDEEVKIVVNHIENDATQPIFNYYNENFPGDIINNPLIVPVNAGEVKLIKISLYINIKPDTAPENVNLEEFVNLRNLNEYE